jgi:hypothetical protein
MALRNFTEGQVLNQLVGLLWPVEAVVRAYGKGGRVGKTVSNFRAHVLTLV